MLNASAPKLRGRTRAAVLAGLVTAAALVTMTPALAQNDPTVKSASNDVYTLEDPAKCAGQTEEMRFRFYYHQDGQGAWINIGHPVYDLKSISNGFGYNALYFCPNTGDGSGQMVANNAASAMNWYEGYGAKVCYSAGYQGNCDYISPRSGMGILKYTKNNNRSIDFYSVW